MKREQHVRHIPLGYPVAPRTGARIETSPTDRSWECAPVAPRTGARIETCNRSVNEQARRSPPARGRGLKLGEPPELRSQSKQVAPRTGARIETCNRSVNEQARRSPPARGRGLKLGEPPELRSQSKQVAPRTGARIETRSPLGTCSDRQRVAPRTGARIETPAWRQGEPGPAQCRPPHGGAD